MLRRPDTPLAPAVVHRLAVVGTLAATMGLLLNMSATDQYGRDHVFSWMYRGLGKYASFEKKGIRFGPSPDRADAGVEKQES